MQSETTPRNFTPHGLVTKWQLEDPYREAKRSIDPRTGSHSKEYYTVSYFEDLFRKKIFNEDKFSMNSQLSAVPRPAAEKACDIVIKHFDETKGRKVLCFAECKRRKNTTRSLLVDLEDQARGYCSDYLANNPRMWHAFACTLVGASIRLWYMIRTKNVLRPMWPGELASFDSYYDTGANDKAYFIEEGFRTMVAEIERGNTEPPPKLDDIRRTPTVQFIRESSPSDVNEIRVDLHKNTSRDTPKPYWFLVPGRSAVHTTKGEWKNSKRPVNGKWVNVKYYVSPQTKKVAWTTDIHLF